MAKVGPTAKAKEISARAKALTHPTRIEILEALRGENLSPIKFAKASAMPVGVVSYHFSSLVKLGCLELVETIPRRGAMEHFYALTSRGKELLRLIEAL